VGPGASRRIEYWRFDPTARRYMAVADPRLPQAPNLVFQMATARTGSLAGRAHLTRNALPQDLFALTSTDVWWFAAGSDGYAPPRRIEVGLGAGQRVLAIGSGPFDGDDLEDLVVATYGDDPAILRVYVFPQQAGGGPRFADASRVGPVLTVLGINQDEGFHPLRADTSRERSTTFAYFNRRASMLFGQRADSVAYRVELPIYGGSALDVVVGDINGDGTPELISSENELLGLIYWVSRY